MCDMATMTLAVPDDVRKKMRLFPQTNWSEIARRAVLQEIERLERLSKLRQRIEQEETQLAWTVDAGRELKRGRAQALKKQGLLK